MFRGGLCPAGPLPLPLQPLHWLRNRGRGVTFGARGEQEAPSDARDLAPSHDPAGEWKRSNASPKAVDVIAPASLLGRLPQKLTAARTRKVS